MIEAVRTYLREIRIRRGLGLEEFAAAIGLSRRALIEWESGRTEELKTTPLIKAVRCLNASLDDICYLVSSEATAEDGRNRADAWIKKGTALRTNQYQPEIEEIVGQLDAFQIGLWLGYGKRLIEEQQVRYLIPSSE